MKPELIAFAFLIIYVGVMMSELNYKELQEQGVFDVPYRAFEFMQEQQKEINELNLKMKRLRLIMADYYTGSFDESTEMAGLISEVLLNESQS